MMKQGILATTLFIFCIMGLAAQGDAKTNSLTLGWGMGNIMRQDFTVSPFVHKDWSPVNLQVVYERSKKLVQQASLKIGHYSPRIGEAYQFYSFYIGEQTTMAHSFLLIELKYAIGKSIMEKGKWNFVLGGKSNNKLYPSTYNFGPSGPSPIYSSFGLDLWLNLRFELNEKHHFNSNVSLPVFSFIYRDPYLAQDDEFFQNLYSHKPLKELTERIKDGQLESWGTSQGFDFDLNYGYLLNDKWEIGCTYLLSMCFNQTPTEYAQLENVIYISGKFKF